METTIKTIEDCAARCAACPRCNFISYSETNPAGHDCSWYTACSATQLKPMFDYKTEHVAKPGSLGSQLVVAVCACSAIYLVGGVAYNVKAKGMKPSAEALPNREFWFGVAALARDGVAFARGGGARQPRQSRGGYHAAPEQEESPKHGKKRSKGRERKEGKEGKESGHSSSSRKPKSDRGSPSAAPPEPAAEPGPAPAPSTASGGGGRWVHVPT